MGIILYMVLINRLLVFTMAHVISFGSCYNVALRPAGLYTNLLPMNAPSSSLPADLPRGSHAVEQLAASAQGVAGAFRVARQFWAADKEVDLSYHNMDV